METTEKVVESYCRYINKWFTIPNIKCKGQYEIDLLAINSVTNERYHIESGVSISGSYSKLTTKDFSTDRLKNRTEMAGQRRTLGYFLDRKFNVQEVLERLADFGFKDGNYKRVIVTWSATKEAEDKAKEAGVLLWLFPKLLLEIAKESSGERTYFTDDTARTIQLFALAQSLQK